MRLFREGLVQLAGRLMIMLRGRSAGFSATKPVLAGRVTSFERGIAWWAKRQTDKSASCAESGSDPKSLTPRWSEDLVADACDDGSIALAVVADLVPSRIILKCRPPRLAICKRLPWEHVG